MFCDAAQIYFNHAKKRRSLLNDVAAAEALSYAYSGCTRSGTLTFVSAVKGTSGVCLSHHCINSPLKVQFVFLSPYTLQNQDKN